MKLKSITQVVLSAALSAVLLCGCANSAETSVTSSATSSVTSSSAQSSSTTKAIASTESVTSSKSSAESSAPVISSTVVSSTPAPETSSSAPVSSSEPAPAVSSAEPPATQSTETPAPVTPAGDTPFAKHGQLSVNGAYLVDQNGQKFQLRGMSTHGIAWFPDYINFDTFKFLRNEWNTNCIRLAMYTAENGGYCTGGNKDYIKGLVKNGVDYATQLGMYVIVDWHILSDQTPLTYKDEAVKFFDEMSSLYADRGNVIYEICNEPNGSGSWQDVTAYANEVIPVIRKNSPNSIVLVGTPTWSQDIDQALNSPLGFNNVMYSLHFYAATHTDWLRNRMESCIQSGLPVFISEFGTCDASGNGAVDVYQSEQWKALIDKYNTSYMCWNLANKNESSSIISAGCSKLSGWTDGDLSRQGQLIRGWFKGETD